MKRNHQNSRLQKPFQEASQLTSVYNLFICHRLPTANNSWPVLMAVPAAQPAEQPAVNRKDWMVYLQK